MTSAFSASRRRLFLLPLAAFVAALPAHGATKSAVPIWPFDAHVDVPDNFDGPSAPASKEGNGQIDLPKIERGGLKGAALAIFVPQDAETPDYLAKARAAAAAKYAAISGLATHYPKQVAIALTPADARRIAASGRFVVIEGIVNGGAFVDSVDDLDAWAKKGVRIFGFVHAGHNRLADSSRPALTRGEGPSRNGGLSPLGKAAVARLNRLGILIDVSQLSDAAFDDVLALSKAPVIATHSDLRALVANSRNLTDAQLDAIRKNGGVVGINAFSAYLRARDPEFAAKLKALEAEYGLTGESGASLPPDKAKDYDARYHDLRATEPKASVTDLVDAVDLAVKRIGIDHVALSSDFNHGGGITGWADEGEAGNVTAELRKRGYRDADIAKLWSGNLLRVWGEAQAVGAKTKA
jgi:microsomal dipeptidase-like Zn-dependent dipeptidase